MSSCRYGAGSVAAAAPPGVDLEGAADEGVRAPPPPIPMRLFTRSFSAAPVIMAESSWSISQ
jgi:hypothetical protein